MPGIGTGTYLGFELPDQRSAPNCFWAERAVCIQRCRDWAHNSLGDIGLIYAKHMKPTFYTRGALMFLIIYALPLTGTGQTQAERQAGAIVVDYMVATVNGDLITYSDVVWQLALQPNAPIEPPRADDLKRTLELIIDQRLIFQEAQKLPTLHADDKEVEATLADLVRHFSSQEELRRRLTHVGLTSEKLREIVHGRVDIEKYLDFRFRNFVVVTAKEIEDYYKDVYVPRFRARSPGAIIPALETVRKEIERTLTESKTESSMQGFLDAMRQRAEIVILHPIS